MCSFIREWEKCKTCFLIFTICRTGILKHASIPLLSESHAEKTKQEPKTENKQPDKISQLVKGY
jgi:hypothetical protein